jgi:ribosome-associated translation inhibitor RaiA
MAIVPLQIKFLHMRRMASLERDITERVQDLQALHGRIIGCHVSVEMPHHSHQSGNGVEVRISLALPGGLAVTRKGSSQATPSTAIKQAFEALKRQLRKDNKKRVAKRKKM